MSRFAGLPAALSAKPGDKGKPEDQPETEIEEDGDEPKPATYRKDKDMAEAENTAVETAKTEARAAGFKAATDRLTAVMASEHYQGREAAAATLLAKESLFSASAGDVIDILATMPKIEPSALLTEEEQREAAEAAGRAEMQAAIAKTSNSDVAAGGGGQPDKKGDADAIWDKAIAKVFPGQKN